jgi:hypothetical protein
MTSQNGECLVLDGILMMLADRVAKFSVEIGVDAPDGRIQCNTVHLLERGWLGLLIDEDAVEHPNAIKARVTAENMDRMLTEYDVPRDLGVLSIDVDGNDYWLWKALPQGWQPSVAVIEYNSMLSGCKVTPYDPEFRWDGTSWFGASAEAMVRLAHAKGYKLVGDVQHANLFFVRAELLPPGHSEPLVEALVGKIIGDIRDDSKARKFEEV